MYVSAFPHLVSAYQTSYIIIFHLFPLWTLSLPFFPTLVYIFPFSHLICVSPRFPTLSVCLPPLPTLSVCLPPIPIFTFCHPHFHMPSPVFPPPPQARSVAVLQCVDYQPCWNSSCLNTVPGYQCYACPFGFTGSFEDALAINDTRRMFVYDGALQFVMQIQSCDDIDECATNNHRCDVNAQCINTFVSRSVCESVRSWRIVGQYLCNLFKNKNHMNFAN